MSVELSVPFLVGSVAFRLNKEEASQDKTHCWTVYIRGQEDEDLSYFISRVIIQLHSSFPDPTRILSSPPYEVTEYGWGEFEVLVKVYFRSGSEKCVQLVHFIKLFGAPGDPSNKGVISERYDEFVFIDPPDSLRALIEEGPKSQIVNNHLKNHWNLQTHVQEEERQMLSMLSKYQHVVRNIFELKHSYDAVEKLIRQTQKKIRLLEKEFDNEDSINSANQADSVVQKETRMTRVHFSDSGSAQDKKSQDSVSVSEGLQSVEMQEENDDKMDETREQTDVEVVIPDALPRPTSYQKEQAEPSDDNTL